MDKKVGRNDPCPCGSGKKYKQCCALKESKKTFTPLGKRKFKAKVLSVDTKSQSVFQESSTVPPQGTTANLDSLKLRFAKNDYRVKEEDEMGGISFPQPEHPEPTPLPFEIPPLPEGEFLGTSEDFRVKKKEEEEG